MSFWNYLQRIGRAKGTDAECGGFDAATVSQFATLRTRGHSVADLLTHYADTFGHLPVEQLRALGSVYRQWNIWRRRSDAIAEARKESKLAALPEDVVQQTVTADELDALVRTARFCPLQRVNNPDEWNDILLAGVALWRACVGLSRKHGRVHCRSNSGSDGRKARNATSANFEAYANVEESISDVAPHRWLAMRRGCRQGALELTLKLPLEQFETQAALYYDRLTQVTGDERNAKSLLDELVLDDIQPWMLSIIDVEAEDKAIQAACESLSGLLRESPLQVRRIAGIYLTRANAPVAAAILDREGDVVTHKTLRADGSWLAQLVEFIDESKVNHVVIPGASVGAALIAALETEMSKLGKQVQRVRTAALAQARLALTDPPLRLTPSVASAAVLARRALDPVKAWSAIDPVSIGVAEYQNDLDEERLRAALLETIALIRLERRRGKTNVQNAPVSRPSANLAQLNPLIKSVDDLKPGMSVQGIVTNISHFGAFVGIGMGQEGLVHISELSDDYVGNPNEVVRIGQQVTAYVLGCDPARGRISLSMKTGAKHTAGSRGPSSAGDRPKRSQPRTRSEALADLERLFKK